MADYGKFKNAADEDLVLKDEALRNNIGFDSFEQDDKILTTKNIVDEGYLNTNNLGDTLAVKSNKLEVNYNSNQFDSSEASGLSINIDFIKSLAGPGLNFDGSGGNNYCVKCDGNSLESSNSGVKIKLQSNGGLAVSDIKNYEGLYVDYDNETIQNLDSGLTVVYDDETIIYDYDKGGLTVKIPVPDPALYDVNDGDVLTYKDNYVIWDTPSIPDVSTKADKVSNATENNLAALDSEGNLIDSDIDSETVKTFTTCLQDENGNIYLDSNNGISLKYGDGLKDSDQRICLDYDDDTIVLDDSGIKVANPVPDTVNANPGDVLTFEGDEIVWDAPKATFPSPGSGLCINSKDEICISCKYPLGFDGTGSVKLFYNSDTFTDTSSFNIALFEDIPSDYESKNYVLGIDQTTGKPKWVELP